MVLVGKGNPGSLVRVAHVEPYPLRLFDLEFAIACAGRCPDVKPMSLHWRSQ